MTESALILASGASAVTPAWQLVSPCLSRDLHVYCHTDKFVPRPPASRLPPGGCPGRRQRGCGR
jgi:hypothetical protein